MKNKILFFAILISLCGRVSAQDSTISKAFKASAPKTNEPLGKPQQGKYPLMAGYLLVKQANAGDPYAEHELGIRYLMGKGFAADTIRALEWIQKAVRANLVTAKFNYGLMLLNETGVNWNPYEAYKQFEFAADKGMPQAQFMYGLFLLDNLVVNRDYTKAYKFFTRSSKGGFKPADEVLAQMKKMNLAVDESGDNTESDKNALQYLADQSLLMNNNWELDSFEFDSDSADSDDTESLLAKVLSEDREKLKQHLGISTVSDSSKLTDTSALGLVKFAAESGSPEALLLYAKGLEKGIGAGENKLESALNYIRAVRLGSFKAAQYLFEITKDSTFFQLLKSEIVAGNPDAMYIWAGLAAQGFDYRINGEQALDFLRKAADMNHTDALIELGLTYYSGNVVEKDKKAAFEYWQKASALGSSEAKVRLVFTSLLEGDRDKCNLKITSLKTAADEGSVLAQAALGYAYENGACVKMNKAAAVDYYRRASNRGNEAAYNSMKKMYDSIRPDDAVFQILE